MEPNPQTRDLEYSFPHLERGVSFSETTSVGFLEILRYSSVNDDEGGEDDKEEEVFIDKGRFERAGDVEAWVLKVCFTI